MKLDERSENVNSVPIERLLSLENDRVETNINSNVSSTRETQKSEIVNHTPRRGKLIRNTWDCKGKPKNMEINLTEIIEPTPYEQAISLPQSEMWKMAMDEELQSLESRNT